MTIIEKFVILAALMGVLGMSTVQTSEPAMAEPAMRCCSYCDLHEDAPGCEYGCKADCFYDQ